MRLVIDTNLWISATFWEDNPPRQLIDFVRDNSEEITVLMSDWLIGEIAYTLNRLWPSYGPQNLNPARIVRNIRGSTESVVVTSKVEVSRDRNDNPVLALAKDGHADYLVTGDKDLLVLKKFGKTHILTAREIIELLK